MNWPSLLRTPATPLPALLSKPGLPDGRPCLSYSCQPSSPFFFQATRVLPSLSWGAHCVMRAIAKRRSGFAPCMPRLSSGKYCRSAQTGCNCQSPVVPMERCQMQQAIESRCLDNEDRARYCSQAHYPRSSRPQATENGCNHGAGDRESCQSHRATVVNVVNSVHASQIAGRHHAGNK